MYRYKKEFEIRFTDVDVFDNLKLSALLAFMEEAACYSAEELGFGYAALSAKHLGFVVVNYYSEIKRPIKLGEKLTVHTWPIRPRHMIFLRDYEFFVGDEKVGVATSRWCMISTSNFTVQPASVYFKEEDFIDYNTERSIDFKAWKLPIINNGTVIYSKNVLYSDYDHYYHVNNTKYADFLMDVYSVEDLEGKYVKSFQINFTKQCKYGEKIDFLKEGAARFLLSEGRVGGETRVQLKVNFDEI